jgi:hypothetical protein
MSNSKRKTIEFGDFQTPPALASQVVDVVSSHSLNPVSVVEPTCGAGSLLEASLQRFEHVRHAIGLEINPEYFKAAYDRVASLQHPASVDMRQADFFRYNWHKVFHELPEPILIIGNPPWVTASQLGSLHSANLPSKSNFQNHRGFDAITGKANFDIAEWMLIHLMQWMSGRSGTLAMLVKQSVARKALFHAWKREVPIAHARFYKFDAKKHFGVSVDACLFVCDFQSKPGERRCEVYDLSSPRVVEYAIGYQRGILLANIEFFEKHEHLLCDEPQKAPYRWRSGIKHDCAKVMELVWTDRGLMNGLGECVTLEDSFLYPMLKGSGVANGTAPTARYMLVTQRRTGDATDHIRHTAPITWKYLEDHAAALDNRGSSIYRRRPRFSVFGVGEYTLAPWKLAICGLYKKLQFKVVGPQDGRPVVFDDTVYFLPCRTRSEALLLRDCLHSHVAEEFLLAFVFWAAKRPITVEVLARLDLISLADELGCLEQLLELRPDISATLNDARISRGLFS